MTTNPSNEVDLGIWGVYRKIKRLLRVGTNQADKRSARSAPLRRQLIDAEAKLARLKELPTSNWSPNTYAGTGFIMTHSIDRKANAIAYAKADIAELRTRIRLSQQLPQTKAKKEVRKNATAQQ